MGSPGGLLEGGEPASRESAVEVTAEERGLF